jgi:hypothetical protein
VWSALIWELLEIEAELLAAMGACGLAKMQRALARLAEH